MTAEELIEGSDLRAWLLETKNAWLGVLCSERSLPKRRALGTASFFVSPDPLDINKLLYAK